MLALFQIPAQELYITALQWNFQYLCDTLNRDPIVTELVNRNCLSKKEVKHMDSVKASGDEIQANNVLLDYIARFPDDKMNIFILEILKLQERKLFDLIMDTVDKVKIGYIPLVSVIPTFSPLLCLDVMKGIRKYICTRVY